MELFYADVGVAATTLYSRWRSEAENSLLKSFRARLLRSVSFPSARSVIALSMVSFTRSTSSRTQDWEKSSSAGTPQFTSSPWAMPRSSPAPRGVKSTVNPRTGRLVRLIITASWGPKTVAARIDTRSAISPSRLYSVCSGSINDDGVPCMPGVAVPSMVHR